MQKNFALTSQAFTLTEIMVTVLILMILSSLLAGSFLTANVSWRTYKNRILVQRQARQALDRMARDLRQGSNLIEVEGVGTRQLSFDKDSEGAIVYTWDKAGANAERIVDSNGRIIATNITDLDFNVQPDYVIIELTADKQSASGEAASITLKEKIALRE